MRLCPAVCATAIGIAICASAAVAHPLAFVGTCTAAEGDIEMIEKTLLEQGWLLIDGPSDSAAANLSWVLASYYFNGDSGGESLTSILELQAKTAQALLKKKDIPQSKSRIFERGGETLRLTVQHPTETLTEYGCQAALSATSTKTLRRSGSSDLPAFSPMPLQKTGNGDAAFTLLNAEKVRPLTPPDAIVITQAKRRIGG